MYLGTCIHRSFQSVLSVVLFREPATPVSKFARGPALAHSATHPATGDRQEPHPRTHEMGKGSKNKKKAKAAAAAAAARG